MKSTLSALVGALSALPLVFSQSDPVAVVDPATGFKFSAIQYPYDPPINKGDLSMGFAFPKDLDKEEYIGYLVARRQGTPGGAGYTGISHDQGMLKSLLLVTWVNGQDIQTSWRYATKYAPPVKYTGPPPKLTKLATVVNASHYSLTYRCENCLSWSQGGAKGNSSIKGEVALFSYAQGAQAPPQPSNPDGAIGMHSLGFGVLPVPSKQAANADFDKMASSPPKGSAAAPAGGAPPVAPAAPKSSAQPPKSSASPPKSSASPPKAGVPAATPKAAPAKGTRPPKSAAKPPAEKFRRF